MKLRLHWQILIAMVAGVLFQAALGAQASFVEPLGLLFIRLLRMIVLPLVFFSIVLGVGRLGDFSALGRLAGKTILYFLGTSALAILTGLFLVNLIQPGRNVQPAFQLEFDAGSLPKPDSITDLLARLIPPNPVAAAVEGDMLGWIVFSIFLGVGITRLSEARRRVLISLLDAGFEALMKITHGVIRLAPLGVFGLMVRMMNQQVGGGFFQAVGWYMVTIALGLTFHFLVTQPLLYYALTRRNPLELYRAMAPALLTVFATSSSMATLPVTMECVEERLGVAPRIAGFVLPVGATVNMDGTALFECVGVLFIAQVLGVSLGWDQQLLVMVTALLASIGAAAVPSSGLVMIFIVLDAVGLDHELIPMIVGTMLAVDRPLDMMRGLVNIMGDAVGAAFVALSEGEPVGEVSDPGTG